MSISEVGAPVPLPDRLQPELLEEVEIDENYLLDVYQQVIGTYDMYDPELERIYSDEYTTSFRIFFAVDLNRRIVLSLPLHPNAAISFFATHKTIDGEPFMLNRFDHLTAYVHEILDEEQRHAESPEVLN